MLERRVSNNRTDLNNDQQMNYLLAWFQHWSDLQKEDFVPIMAEKMSSKYTHLNGLTEDMKAMKCDGPGGNKRPPSLFDCQMGLFKDWFLSWSDDQKNYLVLRLKDIDPAFFNKYEIYLQQGKASPIKDYFEPGIPPELDLSIDRSSTTSEPVDAHLDEALEREDLGKIDEYQEVSFEETSENLSDNDSEEEGLCKHALSPIEEDTALEI
jgi:hypothetical protein